VGSLNRQIAAAQTPSFPTQGGSSCANHFYYGYCTWYVATRRCIPWFGNAGEWYANARAYGYPEGSRPQVGAVVVWGGSPGHVAYVESVQADGFWVSEMNYWGNGGGWGRVDKRFISSSDMGGILGFIYNR
jgi:surface antigen